MLLKQQGRCRLCEQKRRSTPPRRAYRVRRAWKQLDAAWATNSYGRYAPARRLPSQAVSASLALGHDAVCSPMPAVAGRLVGLVSMVANNGIVSGVRRLLGLRWPGSSVQFGSSVSAMIPHDGSRNAYGRMPHAPATITSGEREAGRNDQRCCSCCASHDAS